MRDKDYAIVFSGGGALGSWEVGCLDAIMRHHGGRPPSIVTGASAGALNAAALCSGMMPDEIAQLWRGLTNKDVYAVRPLRTKIFIAAMMSLGGKGVVESVMSQVQATSSVYDTTPLERTLQTILAAREHSFLSSPMGFAISATRLADNEPELFYKMPHGQPLPATAASGKYARAWTPITGLAMLLQALKGTSALPILFPPMEGRFDGGVLLNQPISPAIRMGARNLYVIIPSVQSFGSTEGLLAIGSTLLSTWLTMSLTAQIDQIRLRNRIRAMTGDDKLRLCVIRPALDIGREPGVGLLSFGLKVSELIAAGKLSAEQRIARFDPQNEQTWY